jgi:hypothetical protein
LKVIAEADRGTVFVTEGKVKRYLVVESLVDADGAERGWQLVLGAGREGDQGQGD